MKLSDIEQQVLKLRNSGLSLQEVARVMGWKGRDRVRQVEAKARRKAVLSHPRARGVTVKGGERG